MGQTQAIGASAPAVNRFYFIAWRWHFYASLYVIPFLLMLATTGLLMLWIAQLSGLNGDKGTVIPTGAPMALQALQNAALAAVPGANVTQYIEPLGPNRVAIFKLTMGDASTAVVINPYSGAVEDSFAWSGGWYEYITDIHGSLLIGDMGDRLIEIAASLGVVMVATGLYLHWPRNGTPWSTVLVPRLAAKGRAFWKSIHSTLGFWMSLVMMVFLISGLSWTGIWGEKIVQAWNTFPAEKWDAVPLSDDIHKNMNHTAMKEVPWALEETPMPMSGSDVGAAAIMGPVTLDSVATYARALGFNGRFQINLPADESGVWTISHDSLSNDGPDPRGDRTIHIDQYTGKVLANVTFADYSVYAKMMAVGVAFHQGSMGLWNLILNTVFCLSMIVMPISGLIMWWKRRPENAGRIAAPPRPVDMPLWKGGAVLMLVIGAAFPLAGATLLAVLALDWLIVGRIPALKRYLS